MNGVVSFTLFRSDRASMWLIGDGIGIEQEGERHAFIELTSAKLKSLDERLGFLDRTGRWYLSPDLHVRLEGGCVVLEDNSGAVFRERITLDLLDALSLSAVAEQIRSDALASA